MAITTRLNPPTLDNIIAAQTSKRQLIIPFMMNRSVGWEDFKAIQIIIKTVQTNVVLATAYCDKNSLSKKDNGYIASFLSEEEFPLQIGQYYKIQLAYQSNENMLGFYSTAATFKFTSEPSITIQGLDLGAVNTHTYDYTGHYSNSLDANEKVYSYKFELYDRQGVLLASSGEQLHNSSNDKITTESVDTWTTRQGLQPGLEYLIVYKVKTVNGLEISSPSYRIVDGQTVPSILFKYYNFKAINDSDNGCINLVIQPKKHALATDKKLINGKFVITRASSEDNFQSWHEMTRFILASWDSEKDKFICNDYSVSQGVSYIYALQAYNTQGIYSTKQKTDCIEADFEDMFLSDGDRQLKIKFNPKVSSFKTTLLESKLDTLGGKYPFFFRNGNVEYKEFPISGLISMLMDENETFIQGIYSIEKHRESTPADSTNYQNLQTSLTGDNFRKEREFKLEVLNWLTNGQPKLFRSPSEGSYIVRLMNTSLSPNDTLSRMLHTFSSTAYEMADFTFENLRKYNMIMEDYIETRELRYITVNLQEISGGKISNINASTAVIYAQPNTEVHFKLANDLEDQVLIIGPTGMYNFSTDVLQENPLVELYHADGQGGWFPEATLIYGTFINPKFDSFSYIDSITINDVIAQWIGSKTPEIEKNFAHQSLIKDIGLVYYLNIQKRDIITVDDATESPILPGSWVFTIKGNVHTPAPTELVYCNGKYYDGRTSRLIVGDVDYRIKLRSDDSFVDLQGTGSLEGFTGCEAITTTGGRIILTNISDIDYLYLGNGLYVDIAYQEINKVYTVELEPGSLVKLAKDEWLASKTDQILYNRYYMLLQQTLDKEQEGLIINAL